MEHSTRLHSKFACKGNIKTACQDQKKIQHKLLYKTANTDHSSSFRVTVAVDRVYIMAALPDKDKRIAYAIIRHLQSQIDSRAVTGEAAEGVSGKKSRGFCCSVLLENYVGTIILSCGMVKNFVIDRSLSLSHTHSLTHSLTQLPSSVSVKPMA